jgi:hypothetical protein
MATITLEAFLSDGGGDVDKSWLVNLATALIERGINYLPTVDATNVGFPIRVIDNGDGTYGLGTEGDLNLNGAGIANLDSSEAPTWTASALTIDSTQVAAYAGRTLRADKTTAQTLTIAASAGQGFNLLVYQVNTAQTTIVAGSGLTLRNRLGHTKTAGRWASVFVQVSGTDLLLSGDTAA